MEVGGEMLDAGIKVAKKEGKRNVCMKNRNKRRKRGK